MLEGKSRELVNLGRPGCNREAMDDDELIANLAGGDDTALRELFTRHAPWLATRLRAVLPPSDVEDVLQETFLAVWKNARTYRPQGQAGGWLWVIARRQAALLLRRRGPAAGPLRRRIRGQRAARTPPRPRWPGRISTPPRQRRSARKVPEREVWRLMYVEDRPVAEVAELTGVPEGTVKSRAHRARRLLRAALGGGHADERTRGTTTSTSTGSGSMSPPRSGAVTPAGWNERRRRLLRSPGLARALLTTPSLLVPWLVSTVVVLGRRGADLRSARASRWSG